MTFKNKIQQQLSRDWFIALILTALFLILKGYKFGWDDQHLEIPLLKSLIDKDLYRGDYYVEALKTSFVSYFYIILSHLITVKQVSAAYLTLYVITKYFLLLWVYKLWRLISGQKSIAFLCTMAFMSFGRVPEFIYRTFSHQEFTLAIVFAGIYYFYKERFILSAMLWGIAANLHFLYALFPVVYQGTYLLFNAKKHGHKKHLKSSLVFLTFALPVLVWMIKKSLPAYFTPTSSAEPISWKSLYKLACPQNFIFYGLSLKYIFINFKTWWGIGEEYVLLIALYFLNTLHHEDFKKNFKNHATVIAAVGMLIFTYIFTYVRPTRFVLDLNLVRNTQYLFFFFTGYTTILVIKSLDRERLVICAGITIMYCHLVLGDTLAILSALAIMTLLSFKNLPMDKTASIKRYARLLLLCVLLVIVAAMSRQILKSNQIVKIVSLVSLILTSTIYLFNRLNKMTKYTQLFRRLFIILPLVVLVGYYTYYHFDRINVETKGGGFWKLQRDWEDMQRYVQTNTPKDASLLVPNDMEMGGFRIQSERKIVCCYRDCGIVGFNYDAAVQWLIRLHDIEPFKVIIESDFQPAIVRAIVKYKVNYIVFMRYSLPQGELPKVYQKIYENDSFTLVKILSNNPIKFY